MIFNHIMEIYILLSISVIIHELAHVIIAKIIKLEVDEIHIGDQLFSIRVGKVYFSPLILGKSYVSFRAEKLAVKSNTKKISFFGAGPISNAVICLFAIIFREKSNFYANILLDINTYIFIVNIIPVFDNDMSKLRLFMKK